MIHSPKSSPTRGPLGSEEREILFDTIRFPLLPDGIPRWRDGWYPLAVPWRFMVALSQRPSRWTSKAWRSSFIAAISKYYAWRVSTLFSATVSFWLKFCSGFKNSQTPPQPTIFSLCQLPVLILLNCPRRRAHKHARSFLLEHAKLYILCVYAWAHLSCVLKLGRSALASDSIAGHGLQRRLL